MTKDDLDPQTFPGICSRILGELEINFCYKEILKFLSTNKLPRQTFAKREFGDLPLTLFRHKDFSMEIYTWHQADTSIHDHHFCGAFKVIKGSSIQKTFSFTLDPSSKKSSFLQVGELKVNETRKLFPGDVQEIALNEKFIHQVIHLEHPTITLIIRSNNLSEMLNCYYPKSIRIKYSVNHSLISKITDLFLYLWETKKEEALPMFLKKLDQLSDRDALTITTEPRINLPQELLEILKPYCLERFSSYHIQKLYDSIDIYLKQSKKIYLFKNIL